MDYRTSPVGSRRTILPGTKPYQEIHKSVTALSQAFQESMCTQGRMTESPAESKQFSEMVGQDYNNTCGQMKQLLYRIFISVDHLIVIELGNKFCDDGIICSVIMAAPHRQPCSHRLCGSVSDFSIYFYVIRVCNMRIENNNCYTMYAHSLISRYEIYLVEPDIRYIQFRGPLYSIMLH